MAWSAVICPAAACACTCAAVVAKLPNCTNAVVDLAKLRDYCLNIGHPEGRHKARVFRATLGMFEGDAEEAFIATGE